MPRILLAVSLLLVSTLDAHAQSAATKPYASRVSITAPLDSIESNRCYLVDGNQLIRMELIPVERGGGGVVTTKLWIDVSGETSELKISNAVPRFRAVADRAGVLTVRLGRFEVKDAKRRAQLSGWNKPDFFKTKYPLQVEKIQDGVYELFPAKPLEPGEYAISGYPGTPVRTSQSCRQR